MKATDVALLRELATLKKEIKDREEKAKKLGDYLISKYGIDLPHSFDAPEGKLILTFRESWSDFDNAVAIKTLTQASFNQIAKLSVSDIRKAKGEETLLKLIQKGAVYPQPPSMFYTLRCGGKK